MNGGIQQVLMESGLFDELAKNQKKYASIKESKNLVAVYEQRLFVWNDSGSYVLTSEINSKSESKTSKFKKLTLTSPPIFEVESILFNHTGSLFALSGRNGVMIYEVPWRYGKFSSSNMDQENIIGRSWNIAENFFSYSSKVSIVQVAWHPGSHSNTHLTVLSTDNYIRTYDVTDPQTPQLAIPLCSGMKNTFLSSESKISFSTCFGENSVSFDFGSPEDMQVLEVNSSKISRKFEILTVWPIYLLHGNGDVYVIKSPLERDRSKTKIMGPLTMYPSSEDNYGYDACNVLCLNTVPNCLVIATSNGTVYHSLVLESTIAKEKQRFSWEAETPSSEPDTALYVFEKVELSLSLNEEQDDIFNHPLRLFKDITSKSKYHCSHVSGLHSIAIPFLLNLEESLENDNLSRLISEESKLTSIVEHTVCTKPFSQMESVPVLGTDVLMNDAGVTMICLLANWEFVCIPLVSSYFSCPAPLLFDDNSGRKDGGGSSVSLFGEQIEKTLRRSVCCPYLKSNLPPEVPQQWLDMLCNITQRFREDYVQRLNTAQALLRSRIKVLNQQKEFQLRDINKTLDEKGVLKLSAERLAEKYEDAQATQQTLLKRIEGVLQKFQQNLPYLSKAEIAMKETLLSYEEKLKSFESSLQLIQKKVKHQKEQFLESGDASVPVPSRPDSGNLNEKQIKHVKELLTQEGESISELMKTITVMKKQIGS